jgi:L-lactate dehydrogenase complex protein LldG
MPGISESEFLARVRAGREKATIHWTHDHPELGEPAPPEIADPVAYYVERAKAVFLRPCRVGSMKEAADKVVEILTERKVKKLVRWSDPIVDGLAVDDRLKAGGVTVMRWGELARECGASAEPRGAAGGLSAGAAGKEQSDPARTAAFEADAGLGSADLLVAETGSVLLGAAPGRGRGVSLCPPAYIAVVPAERVVRHLSEGLVFIAGRLKETGRGQFVFLSGPSRTADIEMNLVTGVHGPEFVYIIIVD